MATIQHGKGTLALVVYCKSTLLRPYKSAGQLLVQIMPYYSMFRSAVCHPYVHSRKGTGGEESSFVIPGHEIAGIAIAVGFAREQV